MWLLIFLKILYPIYKNWQTDNRKTDLKNMKIQELNKIKNWLRWKENKLVGRESRGITTDQKKSSLIF